MKLVAQALEAEAFSPFGEVVEIGGAASARINEGLTERFSKLAGLDSLDGDRFVVHIYRSHPISEPVYVRQMERHRLGSQMFYPLHGRPFPVVVAPPGDDPDPGAVRVFITNGAQGINLNPGTWHHYQISLGEPCDYLVIERENAADDCETWTLPEPLRVWSAPA